MSLLLYSLLWWLATPLVAAYLLWRARRQPDYLRHWSERWALRAPPRADGIWVWVHAVSVGETRAAQPLVEALLAADPRVRVLLTHMTPTGRATGAELFGRRHGARVAQAYLPYDYGFATRRFLRAWRPALGLLLETELWPNLCRSALRERVPLALVNARLSGRSLRRGLRWRALTTPALRSLCCVIAQTEADAARIARLGRVPECVSGNLKFDVAPQSAQMLRGRSWREAFGGRPVVLAASTRDGEEALLLRAWTARRVDAERALLVIVPRHPQRFEDVAALVGRSGLSLARRSAFVDGEPAQALRDCDVLLGDSMGEMFAWYAMADVAIVGGSLLPFGAQNLIEACAAGTPVILGPSTYNFADAAAQAIASGAGREVEDADGAVDVALALLADGALRAELAARAREFARAHRGATERTLSALGPWLPWRLALEVGGR